MKSTPRAVVAIAVACLVGATGACGGGTGAEAEPATADGAAPVADQGADLVIWTDDLKIAAIRQIADGFAQDNGITVDVQAITDTQGNFITANSAGNGPDVVVGAHDWIGNMVQNGAIDPIELSEEQLAGYADVAIDAVTYRERLYGLPYGVEALVLYRNTAVVPEEPATLDDALAAGLAAKQSGTVQSAFNIPVGELGDAYHMQPLYTSLGGYVFGRDAEGGYDPTDLGIGDEASVAAAERIASYGEAGSGAITRSVSIDNSIALFAAGQAAFLVSGPWALGDLEAGGVEYASQPIPGWAGAGPAQPFTGVQAFFIASQGENKAFAQEFITTMNSEESMQVMYDLATLPPALTSLQEAEAVSDPDLQAFLDAAEAGEPMPSIPQMGVVFEPFGQAYAALVGGDDPAATMQRTGQTIEDRISG